MNRQAFTVLIVTLALIGGSAGFLLRLRATQKLGVPGLKLAQKPIHDPDGKVVGTNIVDLPDLVSGYESEAFPVTTQELDMLPRDTTFGRRMYKAKDGFEVMLSTVLMGADRSSIHKPQICLVGQGWSIDRSEMDWVIMDRPHPYRLPVMKLTTSKIFTASNGQAVRAHGIYVYWFVADGQLSALHGERMWWIARDLIRTGVLQRWAYVTCFTTCQPGAEQLAYERMKQFIAASVPEFQLATGPRITEATAVTSASK